MVTLAYICISSPDEEYTEVFERLQLKNRGFSFHRTLTLDSRSITIKNTKRTNKIFLGMEHCDSRNGMCQCRENVVGDKCDRCEENHYGFSSCQGCKPCNCGEAAESSQCADQDGKCKCKPGVEGRMCDQCMVGFWNYGPEGCICEYLLIVNL